MESHPPPNPHIHIQLYSSPYRQYCKLQNEAKYYRKNIKRQTINYFFSVGMCKVYFHLSEFVHQFVCINLLISPNNVLTLLIKNVLILVQLLWFLLQQTQPIDFTPFYNISDKRQIPLVCSRNILNIYYLVRCDLCSLSFWTLSKDLLPKYRITILPCRHNVIIQHHG